MTDLLSARVVSKLVGVVDLKDGRAVHAVAGVRQQYKPVDFCHGDPLRLAEYYLGIGISEFYVADLNAIAGVSIQVDVVEGLCELLGNQRILLDVGWAGGAASKSTRKQIDAITELLTSFPTTYWVAATESMSSLTALDEFAGLIPANRLLIGFDFQDQELLGRAGFLDWINAGLRLRIAGSIILDLAQVGGQSGPATKRYCEMVANLVPQWTVFSGGGIRDVQDVDALITAGCDRCLVATALHGIV